MIEILDALVEAKLLEQTSENESVRMALLRMVRPIEDTRHHILAYLSHGAEGPYEQGGEFEVDEEAKGTRRVLSEEFVIDSDAENEDSELR